MFFLHHSCHTSFVCSSNKPCWNHHWTGGTRGRHWVHVEGQPKALANLKSIGSFDDGYMPQKWKQEWSTHELGITSNFFEVDKQQPLRLNLLGHLCNTAGVARWECSSLLVSISKIPFNQVWSCRQDLGQVVLARTCQCSLGLIRMNTYFSFHKLHLHLHKIVGTKYQAHGKNCIL